MAPANGYHAPEVLFAAVAKGAAVVENVVVLLFAVVLKSAAEVMNIDVLLFDAVVLAVEPLYFPGVHAEHAVAPAARHHFSPTPAFTPIVPAPAAL